MRRMGDTGHTYMMPVKVPLPLWWQPPYHHKMSQSPEHDAHASQFREVSLKNGFVSMHLLAVDFCAFQ
jgi:hypothetical protein